MVMLIAYIVFIIHSRVFIRARLFFRPFKQLHLIIDSFSRMTSKKHFYKHYNWWKYLNTQKYRRYNSLCSIVSSKLSINSNIFGDFITNIVKLNATVVDVTDEYEPSTYSLNILASKKKNAVDEKESSHKNKIADKFFQLNGYFWFGPNRQIPNQKNGFSIDWKIFIIFLIKWLLKSIKWSTNELNWTGIYNL